MNWLTSILNFGKTWWPVASFIISLLSGLHAMGAHKDAVNHVAGADSVSAQATHVLGVGGIAGAAFIAGVAGVASNHRAAVNAPSKAPEGVSQVLHQMDVLHSAMLVDPQTTEAELNGLNALVIARKKLRPPLQLAGKEIA
jgi:hypothetical protein